MFTIERRFENLYRQAALFLVGLTGSKVSPDFPALRFFLALKSFSGFFSGAQDFSRRSKVSPDFFPALRIFPGAQKFPRIFPALESFPGFFPALESFPGFFPALRIFLALKCSPDFPGAGHDPVFSAGSPWTCQISADT